MSNQTFKEFCSELIRTNLWKIRATVLLMMSPVAFFVAWLGIKNGETSVCASNTLFCKGIALKDNELIFYSVIIFDIVIGVLFLIYGIKCLINKNVS